MAGEELIEIKFRLADGTDIGPTKYSPSTTVGSLKEKILAQWPKDKENGPKAINDVKLINAGKILENNKTLADSRLPIGELPGEKNCRMISQRRAGVRAQSCNPSSLSTSLHGMVVEMLQKLYIFQLFLDSSEARILGVYVMTVLLL
ncbi:hypothetical protein F0562_027391 [Nyssa sinensis]|uniref:Ubiquitin-like domain-containing protein n=1 Tax=Nyssa sinensis TaxID=561372 RepID=A0A5J5B5Q5_9ASTE|nr:hypothetical protein F0562_027391 [Nyssa sinensis]